MCYLNNASNRRKIMTHDDHRTVIFTGFAPCNPFFGQMNKTQYYKKLNSYQLSMQGHLKTGSIL